MDLDYVKLETWLKTKGYDLTLRHSLGYWTATLHQRSRLDDVEPEEIYTASDNFLANAIRACVAPVLVRNTLDRDNTHYSIDAYKLRTWLTDHDYELHVTAGEIGYHARITITCCDETLSEASSTTLEFAIVDAIAALLFQKTP